MGAQVGIIAGLGVALLLVQNADCTDLECVGKAGMLPLALGAGMLGGMVVGGAVGLAIGTWVDDEGESREAAELRIRIAVP